MKRFLFRMFYFFGFHGIAKKIDPIAYYFYHLNDSFREFYKQMFEALNEQQEKREFDNTFVSEEIANCDTEQCHTVYETVKSMKE